MLGSYECLVLLCTIFSWFAFLPELLNVVLRKCRHKLLDYLFYEGIVSENEFLVRAGLNAQQVAALQNVRAAQEAIQNINANNFNTYNNNNNNNNNNNALTLTTSNSRRSSKVKKGNNTTAVVVNAANTAAAPTSSNNTSTTSSPSTANPVITSPTSTSASSTSSSSSSVTSSTAISTPTNTDASTTQPAVVGAAVASTAVVAAAVATTATTTTATTTSNTSNISSSTPSTTSQPSSITSNLNGTSTALIAPASPSTTTPADIDGATLHHDSHPSHDHDDSREVSQTSRSQSHRRDVDDPSRNSIMNQNQNQNQLLQQAPFTSAMTTAAAPMPSNAASDEHPALPYPVLKVIRQRDGDNVSEEFINENNVKLGWRFNGVWDSEFFWLASQGQYFLKFVRFGSPHQRKLKVALDTKGQLLIDYESGSFEAKDVLEVTKGKKKNNTDKAARDELCFNITARKKSLHLQATTQQMRDLWVYGLQELTNTRAKRDLHSENATLAVTPPAEHSVSQNSSSISQSISTIGPSSASIAQAAPQPPPPGSASAPSSTQQKELLQSLSAYPTHQQKVVEAVLSLSRGAKPPPSQAAQALQQAEEQMSRIVAQTGLRSGPHTPSKSSNSQIINSQTFPSPNVPTTLNKQKVGLGHQSGSLLATPNGPSSTSSSTSTTTSPNGLPSTNGIHSYPAPEYGGVPTVLPPGTALYVDARTGLPVYVDTRTGQRVYVETLPPPRKARASQQYYELYGPPRSNMNRPTNVVYMPSPNAANNLQPTNMNRGRSDGDYLDPQQPQRRRGANTPDANYEWESNVPHSHALREFYVPEGTAENGYYYAAPPSNAQGYYGPPPTTNTSNDSYYQPIQPVPAVTKRTPRTTQP